MSKSKRKIRFTLIMNEEERKMLPVLARVMNRSQSDVIRELLRQATKSLVGEDFVDSEITLQRQ